MLRAIRATLSVLPLLIIGGLLYAAVFVKPNVSASTVVPPPIARGEYMYGVASLKDGAILGVGSGGKIWRISPGEQTIMSEKSPTSAALQDIATWNDGAAVAVGDGGTVLVSQDQGKSWSTVKVTLSSVANKLVRVRAIEDGSAWAVGEMGAALKSTDHGATWNRVTSEEDKSWNDVFVVGNKVWLVGEFGRISSSSDGGATWSNVASPVKNSLMAVAFRDDMHGVAVGVDGTVLSTTDGGVAWAVAPRVVTSHLFDVTWDGKEWLAVGDMGVLLIGDASGAHWRESRVTPDNRQWHTKIVRDGDRYVASGGSVDVVGAL
ncbi:WD40/YVTN/BNR-like repeat-containing protein [Burkholderia sp. Bp9142]|uniref:WD40/YVTN/BNR-like repeat-containing protein n=1 Tax=Burkholderia sp. Bp9142 TaxID=2184573 RepID=UPI0016270DC3|nr:YCF48-related protein [Burkholderia sp. Bp9142]